MKKAVVVGSGIAGIASSIRLAVKGYQVEVFEANAYPGGKLSAIEGKGYRFDAGPSLFTLPEQVEELFHLAGKNPKDHFEYERLDVVCHYFWEDGKKVKAWADPDRFATEVATQLRVSDQGIKEVLKRSAFIYEHLAPLFMHRSLRKVATWLGPQALKAYLNLGKLGLFSTMHASNTKLLKDPKLVQLFNRYATYNGSDPYQTPATLTIIPHLEFNLGAYFPKQGMHDISMSLYKLALSLGVRYHFNAPVEEILVEKGRACGLRVQGEDVAADLVVNNMDMVNAYKTILKKQVQPKTCCCVFPTKAMFKKRLNCPRHSTTMPSALDLKVSPALALVQTRWFGLLFSVNGRTTPQALPKFCATALPKRHGVSCITH